MRIDKTKVGLVRPIKQRHTKARQTAAVTAAGASLVYVIGESGVESWRDVMRQRRPGDTLWIEHLALLPDMKSERVKSPAADLADAMDEARDRGVVIIEAVSGRRSDDAAQRSEMRAIAIRALGSGGRSLSSEQASANAKGRPRGPKPFPPDVVEQARMVWDALRRYPTWADAAKAMPPGFSVYRAYRMWGDRGQLAAPAKSKSARCIARFSGSRRSGRSRWT